MAMEIKKIGKRSIIFSQYVPDGWNLHIHLILGDAYNYIIDSGLGSGDMEEVLTYIGQSDKPIILINTHYHWDHIWGNYLFKEGMIVAHRRCRQIIDEKWDSMLAHNKQYVHGFTERCLPNITFDSELYFEKDKIRLIYTPGHTEDGICIIDEEDKVLNVGDNIGDDMAHLIPNLYCEKKVYLSSLEKYLDIEFDYCVSGHNQIVTKETIKDIIKMLI